MMSLPFFAPLIHRLATQWPILFYAATWTSLLTLTVALASFTPEIAFMSAISPTSSFSRPCEAAGALRVPMDFPGDVLCVSGHLLKNSKIDSIVPPIFAAILVAGSAWVVRSMALWETDEAR
ncbi:hypothetical protein HS088_TW03G01294 [Tripterygium wilfordii]|uniref:Uncharacterized protein n=1 Tax=Tripterygium wilfordii TaxID=458696 RepID=A0A7J7DXQ4_TRIWF|nr:uncharacterized protein LOC119995709 [Tripterygium wilfordii]KAF5750954.1 hypothetical protein HS088_TW03G01294 [Tripterygium wilfordii]